MLLAAAMALAAAGCSDTGEDTSAGQLDEGQSSRAGPPRPSMNPAGTEPGAVEPYISELLLAYDRAVNQLDADPTLVQNPDSAEVTELLDVFEPDSSFTAALIEVWSDHAEEGFRTLPFRDDYPAKVTALDGPVETVSEDEVTFPLCVVSRTKFVDGDGNEMLPALPRIDYPGQGVAVRTDDGWRLRSIEVSTGELQCREDRG